MGSFPTSIIFSQLAPSDSHLFRVMQNFLTEKKYHDRDHLEQDMIQFFSSQSEEFYRNGIHILPERWQQVVDNDGQYIID